MIGFMVIIVFAFLFVATIAFIECRDEIRGRKYQVDDSFSWLLKYNSEKRRKYRFYMPKIVGKK